MILRGYWYLARLFIKVYDLGMNKTGIFYLSVKTALIFLLMLAFISACKKQESPEAEDSDTSYAFGMLMANQMNGQMGLRGLHFDYEAFMQGFRDFNEANETRLTQEKAVEKINQAVTQLQAKDDERLWLEGEKNREEGEAYMTTNGARSGVTTTASGLQYEVISQGGGAKPGPNDTVRVHYEGSLIDGQVFESSFDGEPIEFSLQSVIQGWQEGVQLMNEGSTYRFVIPSDLAYGASGAGPIPPSATLIFKVELLSILK